MGIRIKPKTGEYYHVYNRGTEKRTIFLDEMDLKRFIVLMKYVNTTKHLPSLSNNYTDINERDVERSPLVEFAAFHLLGNHFHFVLHQIEEDGVSRYMQRLITGYTMYFNKKYQRSGALFQGKYKHKHIETDEYLQLLLAYVNLNDYVHKTKGPYSFSSLEELGVLESIVNQKYFNGMDREQYVNANTPIVKSTAEKRLFEKNLKNKRDRELTSLTLD